MIDQDSAEAYEFAQARSLEVREAWIGSGRELVLMQANGVLGIHPLWKVMLEAENQASRLRDKLRARRAPGRPVGSTSAPDREPRPDPILRAVGSSSAPDRHPVSAQQRTDRPPALLRRTDAGVVPTQEEAAAPSGKNRC